VAKAGLAHPFPCSYRRSKFPNQNSFGDVFEPDCGNGKVPDGSAMISGADPNDAFVANSLANQQAWVQHTIGAKGLALNGGLKYYVLDNEHDLWWSTHHDVVPQNPHNTDEFNHMRDYSLMIKGLDPNALVVGPEISGWIGSVL